MAKVLDVKPQLINDIEKGRSKNPSSDFLLRLIDRIGLSPNYLVEKGPMFIPGREPDFGTPRVLEKVINQLVDSGVNMNLDERQTSSHIKDAVPYIEERRRTTDLAPLPPGYEEGRALMLGMPMDVTVYKFKKGHPEPIRLDEPDPEGVVFIPMFSQTASAGPGQEATQALEETESYQPIMYDLLGGRQACNCGIVRVVGDSMTDITLNNGDWAVFDRDDRRGDGIFVISMFGETRVKRLQYRLSDQKIVIASENARRYPDAEIVGAQAIETGNLVIHGRVFSWLHKHQH